MVAPLARASPPGLLHERGRDTPGVGWYEPLDWVLVRSPLLPVERYLGLQGVGRDGSEAELPQAVRDPVVRRAIAVASPSLFERLGRPPSSPSALRRWRLAVLRYLIRMSTRPTPYGLNAAVSLGRWGAETDVELGSPEVVRARLDMGLLDALIGELEGRLEVVRKLHLETHPTVTVRGGRAFLPERLAGGSDAFEVSVRATRPVLRALEFCRGAPAPFADLAAALGEDFPDAGSRIEELIHTLVREGLLVSELRPPLTRGDPARYLLSRLDRVAAARVERDRLAAAVEACERWELLAAADGAERFPAVLRAARAVASEPPEQAPVRVDMMRPLAGERIARAVGEEAARAAELLLRLSPAHSGSGPLNSYRNRFVERYPAPTEVPLMELIQPDVGLGSPNLLADAAGDRPADKATERRNRRLLEIATSALRADELSVELDSDVIAELDTEPRTDALHPTVEIAVFVAAASREALDAGEFRVVVSPMLGSYGAGKILGRFAYLFDGQGGRAMAEAARRQELGAHGSLCAELVYSPERPWLSNVMVRPARRSHEIVVGVSPGVRREGVIPVDELVVGVRDDAFYLRWPKGDTYVEVCESHMLNPIAAPAVCTFLAQMRYAGRPVMTAFQWGPARELPRLPRVESGRIVLSPATWRPPFGSGALDADSPYGFASALESWRTHWRLPRRVFAAEGDNRLLLDLDDPHQVELLRGLVRSPKDTDVVLQEALPGINEAWLPGPGGGFLVELAVPLARNPASLDGSRSNDRRPPARLVPPPRTARVRAPGSEWLYAKVYAPGTIAEELLAGPLRELAGEALASGLADDWFFIRYRDERPHLRVRFHGEPRRVTGELAPRLYAWASVLMERGACQALVLDTYERELERYGGEPGMDVAEAIFGVDSRVVLELIRLDLSRAIAVPRELLCVLTLDCLLEGLGLDSAARLRWCADHVPSRHEVTAEWREHKDELRALLGSRGGAHEPLAPLLESFVRDLRPHGERLVALRDEGAIQWPAADEMLASFAHMHCNRLLGLDRDAEHRALGLFERTRESLARAPIR
jgi:thiopeptide-type bacteriocin biosynthesis protein